MFNNWNLDRGIHDQKSEGLAWKSVTTGNFGGIDLWMKDAGVGAISFETRHCKGAREISALGAEPVLFAGGGLGRAVALARLPEKMDTTRLNIQRRMAVPSGRDTRLYVRVTQEDGHRAWSSPIYLFR
jgi:hypothetical protein